jgi:DNA-binding winged helix-turn-helix (wHTH) protein
MADADASRTVRFGAFEVDLRAGELRKNGIKIKLQEQPFRVLVTLLEHAGNVVTREELRRELWPTDTFVDFEHGLNAAVKQLRDALGDSAEKPRFVETLARRGYRFIAPVDKPGAPPLAPHRDGARSARATCTACDCSDRRGAGHRRAGWSLNWAGTHRWGIGASGKKIESLAVLPLQNLSHDPEQEYFSDGMTDALTTQLSKAGTLWVTSRTSAMQYKGTHKSLPEIARELKSTG